MSKFSSGVCWVFVLFRWCWKCKFILYRIIMMVYYVWGICKVVCVVGLYNIMFCWW